MPLLIPSAWCAPPQTRSFRRNQPYAPTHTSTHTHTTPTPTHTHTHTPTHTPTHTHLPPGASPLLLLHPRGRPQPPHRLRLLLHWHLHSVTRPVACRPRYIRLRPARGRVRRTARCVCVCLLPLSIVSNPHPSLLCLSFAPKCGLIMEVFAAWLTRHVTCDNADTQWLYHPSTSTTTAAACCNANFLPSCICVTLCTCALPQLYFCDTWHMYTYQMDTCMGMGFIDTEESRAPKVTSIDPTSGPRAGGSQIVVAGSGQRPRPHPLHTSHSTVVTCDSLPQAS